MDRCAHYTLEPFNHLLVQSIELPEPRQVVDLGVGGGSLLAAAAQRWQQADLLGIDVCAETLRRLQNRLPAATVRRADLMRGPVLKLLETWSATADVVLCNPPFTQTPSHFLQSEGLLELLPKGLPATYLKRAEVVFLLHTLRLLRPGGEMGLVLPACFASGTRYAAFRAWFFSRCSVSRVVQLPTRAFASADVHAFLWVAKNLTPPRNAKVELAMAQQDSLIWRRKLACASAVHRCDAHFHSKPSPKGASLTLAETGARVSRGRPVLELRKAGKPFFHTTHFSELPPNRRVLGIRASAPAGHGVASAGDFLLGRVGRHCHAQLAQVGQGAVMHSDCVYRIQVPKAWRAAVKASLFSAEGLAWRESRLRGSATRLLALEDLLQHPIASQGEKADGHEPQLAERAGRSRR